VKVGGGDGCWGDTGGSSVRGLMGAATMRLGLGFRIVEMG
jgi:hypothetical protein